MCATTLPHNSLGAQNFMRRIYSAQHIKLAVWAQTSVRCAKYQTILMQFVNLMNEYGYQRESQTGKTLETTQNHEHACVQNMHAGSIW